MLHSCWTTRGDIATGEYIAKNAKNLTRSLQPLCSTWIAVSLILGCLHNSKTRLHSHWLIIFNRPIKIFLAYVEAKQGHSTAAVFILNHGRQYSDFCVGKKQVHLQIANKGSARLLFLFSTTGDNIRFFRLEMQGVALERLLNDSPWSHAFAQVFMRLLPQ